MAKTDVLLGVLAARRTSQRRPYHEQTTFFRRLVREGETIGVRVFIFSPPGVNWKRRKIRGWTWTGSRWIGRTYPFPDAVFDRVSPKGVADLGGVTRARRGFRRRAVPMFNTRLGSKWQMHRTFRKNAVLSEALPPTRILTLGSLHSMIERFGEVYTKPVRGGQGRGVAWAKRVPGGYVYRVHGRRGTRSGRVRTLGALRARCGACRRRSLVQKAIPILRFEGCVFDVRVLAQREGDGEWHVTGAVARLSAPRARITNIHAGGKARPLEDVLQGTGADEAQVAAVFQRAYELALETAEAVSQGRAHVAELGVDLAVDTEYRCWILEANSRTGRISFHRAGLEESARRADRNPAEYARFLAGKPR